MKILKKTLIIALIFSSIISCTKEKPKLSKNTSEKTNKGATLYSSYCASCHIIPEIQDLPKQIWKKNILPLMGTRMGIISDNYNSLEKNVVAQIKSIQMAGLSPNNPMLSIEDWELLKNYIITSAPDSLLAFKSSSTELTQFTPSPIALDKVNGTFITFLQHDSKNNKLITGDIAGNLFEYNFKEDKVSLLNKYQSAITDYTEDKDTAYITSVGRLDPSEIASGKIFVTKGKKNSFIPQLHRPVNTLVVDLNKNGKKELVISEFGNLRGELSLYKEDSIGSYKKINLLAQPGAIRTLVKDMNKDGKDDLIVLMAQGDENITILYNQGDLSFKADKVIRFSPVYGISWFEVIDYNGDGYDDIITVNGDNADFSYVQKPYHGLRIHINNGKNNFEEKYFYPLNGATRFVVNDFDQDGDVDFGVISTFPDYIIKPEFSFVYLENNDSESFDFDAYTFEETKLGRWFLLDSGDIDNDGDEDIILSSFTYVFSPVPESLMKLWNTNKTDILVLKNNLKN